MKLRIHRNSIRLRLSQTDITKFGHKGYCEEELRFSNSTLKYILKRAKSDEPIEEPQVDLKGNEVIVVVPFSVAEQWTQDETMVGFHNKAYENEDSAAIQVLVEKDFQCLHKRPKEDESDSFPNPNA